MFYVLIIFTKDARDITHTVPAERLDKMILSAIWTPDFSHMVIREAAHN